MINLNISERLYANLEDLFQKDFAEIEPKPFIQHSLKAHSITIPSKSPVIIQKAILYMVEMKTETNQKKKYETLIYLIIIENKFVSGNSYLSSFNCSGDILNGKRAA